MTLEETGIFEKLIDALCSCNFGFSCSGDDSDNSIVPLCVLALRS